MEAFDGSQFDSWRLNTGNMIYGIWKAFLVEEWAAGEYLGKAPLWYVRIIGML